MFTLPFKFTRRVVDPVVSVLAIGCWAGAVLLCLWPSKVSWRGQALLSVIFPPRVKSRPRIVQRKSGSVTPVLHTEHVREEGKRVDEPHSRDALMWLRKVKK